MHNNTVIRDTRTGDFSNEPAALRTLEAIAAWIKLRVESKYGCTTDERGHYWLSNWYAEVSHSPTLWRIMNAKPIYKLRPPVSMSYPSHELLDQGWSWFRCKAEDMQVRSEPEFSGLPEQPHIRIHNDIFLVDEQVGPEEFIVRAWPQTEWQFRISRYPEMDTFDKTGALSDYGTWRLDVLTERELHPDFVALYKRWRENGWLLENELTKQTYAAQFHLPLEWR